MARILKNDGVLEKLQNTIILKERRGSQEIEVEADYGAPYLGVYVENLVTKEVSIQSPKAAAEFYMDNKKHRFLTKEYGRKRIEEQKEKFLIAHDRSEDGLNAFFEELQEDSDIPLHKAEEGEDDGGSVSDEGAGSDGGGSEAPSGDAGADGDLSAPEAGAVGTPVKAGKKAG